MGIGKVAYIGVPFSSGSPIAGTEKAPALFRKLDILGQDGIYDAGDIQFDSSCGCSKRQGVNNLDSVLGVNRLLADRVDEVLREESFPIVVGGDHSIALGSISGVLRTKQNLAVLYIDAHGDFNNEATSPSANAHGMPCSALMGWCSSELNNLPPRFIDSKNIYWIGTRSLDDGEVKSAIKHNLNIYTSESIKSRSISQILSEILLDMKSKGVDSIHCSIDVDSLDPSCFGATGLPVPSGISEHDLYTIIDVMFSTSLVCSLDFVEYNPLLDCEYKNGKWCVNILSYIIKKII